MMSSRGDDRAGRSPKRLRELVLWRKRGIDMRAAVRAIERLDEDVAGSMTLEVQPGDRLELRDPRDPVRSGRSSSGPHRRGSRRASGQAPRSSRRARIAARRRVCRRSDRGHQIAELHLDCLAGEIRADQRTLDHLRAGATASAARVQLRDRLDQHPRPAAVAFQVVGVRLGVAVVRAGLHEHPAVPGQELARRRSIPNSAGREYRREPSASNMRQRYHGPPRL